MELQNLIFRHRPPHQMNIAVLYAIQSGRCAYCGRYMFFRAHRHPGDNGYTVDHFFPHSKGFGKSGNAVLACRKCNELKENRLPSMKQILYVMKLYARFNITFICHGFNHKQSSNLRKHGVHFRRVKYGNVTSLVPVFDFDDYSDTWREPLLISELVS